METVRHSVKLGEARFQTLEIILVFLNIFELIEDCVKRRVDVGQRTRIELFGNIVNTLFGKSHRLQIIGGIARVL